MNGASVSSYSEKVSVLSPASTTNSSPRSFVATPPNAFNPTSPRNAEGAINDGGSGARNEAGSGSGLAFSIKSFRRKKVVNERLHPLGSGSPRHRSRHSHQQRHLSVAPSTPRSSANIYSPHVDKTTVTSPENSDDEVLQLQRLNALLASRETIEEWIRSYELERGSFASFAVFTEVKLDEVQGVYVEQIGRPNAVEAAACCATLLKMPGIVGCYKTLLEKMSAGIQGAIYLPDNSSTSPAAEAQTPVAMAALVQRFYSRTPYFERVRELEKTLVESRSITDPDVLRAVTSDDVARIFQFVPFQHVKAGLTKVYATSSAMLDQLMSALQEQQALFQFSRRGDTGPDDPDYPVHIPLATSAQICRAIKQHSATFSSSGRDMILCAIVDLVEFESFRNVYQKFDVHGKACFLHNLSIMDSMDILQCVVEELPHAGDTLFRMYLATCSGNVGELPDNKKPEQIVPKDIFFSKLLSPDMEFFFVSDLAAYLTEAQWQLLSKEFEKNEKERKARKKPQANVKTEAVEFDIEIFEDEVDENPTTLISASPSIDRFEMIMLNYLRHQNLSSAQLLQLVANTFLSMLDEKEFSELIDKCWSRFPLDGQWSKALAVVQDLGTNKNPVPPSSSTTGSTEEMNYERIAAIRLKLLKKTFMMLSQEERAAWIDRTNAKHPTETYKKKIQDLEDAAEFAMNKPPDLSDPETHVSNMKGEMKMRWLDAIVDAMLTDPEQSKRISALKQVLQPFANGKTPPPVIPTSSTVTPSSPSSVARSAAIAPPRPATSPAQPTPLTLATAEVGLEQLLSQLNPADKAVFLSKFSPSPAETQKGPDKEVIHRASSPVGFVEEQLPSVETGSPEIQKTLQALLEQKSETQVLEILQDELENSSSDEEPEVPVAENILETPSTGVSLSSRLKRKLTAVTAVAEPMEWQEYVKVGCLDVGCQTNFESEQQPIEATNSTDSVSVVPNVKVPNRGNHRTSTAPTKTVPLTLASLLGKNNGIMNTAGGKSKKDKYQKISSTSVPRSIAGLITSWRMNTEQLTQFAKKSLATVLKIIADAFSEMLTANRRKAQQQQLSYATPRGSGRTLTLSQIVYQSFLHSYGLPSIADMHLLAFSCALETYRLQHLRAEYFARFCFDEVPKSELTNYLEFLEYIVCDDLSVCTLGPNTPMNPPSTPHSGISNSRTSSLHSALPMPTVASKRIRHVPKVNVPDKENWQISLDRAQEIAQLCFRDMRKSAVVAFCENLATIAVQGNSTAILPVPTPAEAPNGELLVNVDHLLQLAVTEWKREQTRRERHLMDAFRAGDVNGDGQLTSAEFTQIVLSIDASRDQGDILLMYSDTLRRTECEQLSPEIFLQVAREHELDRVVWQGDGELFGVVNEVTDMEATWTHVRGFFVGTLESLARDLPAGHFLRVCEGAGCGCLKCLLDGYVGFQTMRRDFAATQNQQQQPAQQGKRNSEVGVSSQLVWARFWHLMRQLHDAATESGGIITPWEGVEYIREQAVQPLAPRSNNRRRDSLPNFLFPDTARITAKMSQAHEPEAFDAPTIHSQFAYLLRHVSTKTSEST